MPRANPLIRPIESPYGDGTVFAVDVDGGTLRQLTDIRLETAPRRDTAKAKEQRAELEREQQELLGVLRDRRQDRLNRERTDATRDALTRAARTLFVSHGYAQTSTPQVCAVAGITRRTWSSAWGSPSSRRA